MIERGQRWKRNENIIDIVGVRGAQAEIRKDGAGAMTVPLPELWDLLQKHEFKVQPGSVSLRGLDYDEIWNVVTHVTQEDRPALLFRAYKAGKLTDKQLDTMMLERLTAEQHEAVCEEMGIEPFVFPFRRPEKRR